MTMQELITLVQEEMHRLQDSSIVDSSELDFYENLFDKFPVSSISNLIEIPSTDLMIAFLNSHLPDKLFDEIHEDVSSFSDILENFSDADLQLLDLIIHLIIEHNMTDSIKASFSDYNRRRGIRILFSKFDQDNKLLLSPLKELLESENCSGNGVLKLLEYYEEYPDVMTGAFSYISVLKEIKEDQKKCNDIMDDYDSQYGRLRGKDRKKFIYQQMKNGYHINTILQTFDEIRNYYHRLLKSTNKEQKRVEKELRSYEEFLSKLPEIFQKDIITNYESFLKKLSNSEIRLAFLKLVYQHNLPEYEKTEHIYKKLAKNSAVHYLALLKDYRISKDEVVLSKIMENSYEDVSSMLTILSSFIDSKTLIIYALETSNLEQVTLLKDLKDKGVLLVDAFYQYPHLFVPDSSEVKSLKENMEILEQYHFNAANVAASPEVLIENSHLQENFFILDEYQLLKSLKSGKDYRYLGNSQLQSRIDTFLELGLESYLVEDLSLLNEENLDRLRVLRMMHYEIESKEELLQILRKDTFIVPDSEIHHYVPNVVPFYQKERKGTMGIEAIPALVNYEKSPRVYEVGGIPFSKPKVLRNYSSQGDLFQALICDCVLSEEEMIEIQKEIQKTILKK